MNAPQFVISGKERREKKRELASLRHLIHNFWMFRDMEIVYGTSQPLCDDHARLKQLKSEAEALERLLSRQIGEK
jgi:hypothetical protein